MANWLIAAKQALELFYNLGPSDAPRRGEHPLAIVPVPTSLIFFAMPLTSEESGSSLQIGVGTTLASFWRWLFMLVLFSYADVSN